MFLRYLNVLNRLGWHSAGALDELGGRVGTGFVNQEQGVAVQLALAHDVESFQADFTSIFVQIQLFARGDHTA